MRIQRIAKKEVVIAVVALLVGLGLGFYTNNNKINTNKEITRRIIDNCIQSMTAVNTLESIWKTAYNELGICAISSKTCNVEESKKKFESLNKQKGQAEEEIRRLTKDMDSIIEEVKKSK